MKGYYFITDTRLSLAGNARDVEQALAAGVRVVQHRDKEADLAAMIEEARILRRLCQEALFLVNDRVEVALAVDADGVHLGQEDLHYRQARRLLGGRTKSSASRSIPWSRPWRRPASGPTIWACPPSLPPGPNPMPANPPGCSLLRKIRVRVKLPLVAIGGITLDNAPDVIQAGADSVCAISAVVTGLDVRTAIQEFQKLFNSRNNNYSA